MRVYHDLPSYKWTTVMIDTQAMMEKTEEETHVEPGAARCGNFPDYYRFNPAHERMKYLREITEGSLHHLSGYGVVECLDIGCNTGVRILFYYIIKFALLYTYLLTHWLLS